MGPLSLTHAVLEPKEDFGVGETDGVCASEAIKQMIQRVMQQRVTSSPPTAAPSQKQHSVSSLLRFTRRFWGLDKADKLTDVLNSNQFSAVYSCVVFVREGLCVLCSSNAASSSSSGGGGRQHGGGGRGGSGGSGAAETSAVDDAWH